MQLIQSAFMAAPWAFLLPVAGFALLLYIAGGGIEKHSLLWHLGYGVICIGAILFCTPIGWILLLLAIGGTIRSL